MKSDKRRITAKERVEKYCITFGETSGSVCRALIKMLGDHVKAAHKRHARKNVCFRPEDKINPVEAFNRLVELSNRRKTS